MSTPPSKTSFKTPTDYTAIRTIDTWESLRQILAGDLSGSNWAFRGQRVESWPLMSSLERLAPASSAKEYERYVLAAMKRRAHQYIRDVPPLEDTAEWLALAQHHGAPTRLLDWSRSPYVSLYFAIEDLIENSNAALWAIDYRLCKRFALDAAMKVAGGPLLLNEDDSFGSPEYFDLFFINAPTRFVAPLQPQRLNERITVQQGLFLCASDIAVSFETNLCALLAFVESYYNDLPADFRPVQKIIIPGLLRLEILRELNRMNVNAASLFPGIDGYARALRVNVGIFKDTPVAKLFVEGFSDDQI